MSNESFEARLPSDDDIVSSIISNSNVIFGVPDKAEIFRLADLVPDSPYGEQLWMRQWLNLRILRHFPTYTFKVRQSPGVSSLSGSVEHAYNIQLDVMSVQMALIRIRVIHGSRTDESQAIVFEADEYPDAAFLHRFRVIRVTVREDGWATYEVIASTHLR